jgi:hypothetical protein
MRSLSKRINFVKKKSKRNSKPIRKRKMQLPRFRLSGINIWSFWRKIKKRRKPRTLRRLIKQMGRRVARKCRRNLIY